MGVRHSNTKTTCVIAECHVIGLKTLKRLYGVMYGVLGPCMLYMHNVFVTAIVWLQRHEACQRAAACVMYMVLSVHEFVSFSSQPCASCVLHTASKFEGCRTPSLQGIVLQSPEPAPKHQSQKCASRC